MLSQVALATLEVPAGKRPGAHLLIHVSPERLLRTFIYINACVWICFINR